MACCILGPINYTEPTRFQPYPLNPIVVKFYSKFTHFLSSKHIWKCQFVHAPICYAYIEFVYLPGSLSRMTHDIRHMLYVGWDQPRAIIEMTAGHIGNEIALCELLSAISWFLQNTKASKFCKKWLTSWSLTHRSQEDGIDNGIKDSYLQYCEYVCSIS